MRLSFGFSGYFEGMNGVGYFFFNFVVVVVVVVVSLVGVYFIIIEYFLVFYSVFYFIFYSILFEFVIYMGKVESFEVY